MQTILYQLEKVQDKSVDWLASIGQDTESLPPCLSISPVSLPLSPPLSVCL